MQRTKTLAYESKIPAVPADKPDSVAPASGIRLVRPPLSTLPGASSVPPPPSVRPSRPAREVPAAPPVRPIARTLPLAIAPMPVPAAPLATARAADAKAPTITTAKSTPLFGSPKTMVPPPPPSGPRARGLSTAPPPSKRPPRPSSHKSSPHEPDPQMLDDDSVVEDDAVTVAEPEDLVEIEATLVSPPSAPPRSSRPPSAAAPRKLPSLRATGQNWPRVEWPRLDHASIPRSASARRSAPPRPASSPPPPPAEVAMMVSELEAAELEAAAAAIEPIQPIPDLPADLGGTAFDAEAARVEAELPGPSDDVAIAQVDGHLDATVALIASHDDVYVDAPAPRTISMEMLPPPPTANDVEASVGETAMVFSDDDDVIDFRPVSPLVRLRAMIDPERYRAALAQVRPILAWLDRNPRAFASVGFGAGVVVALFVALVVG